MTEEVLYCAFLWGDCKLEFKVSIYLNAVVIHSVNKTSSELGDNRVQIDTNFKF